MTTRGLSGVILVLAGLGCGGSSTGPPVSVGALRVGTTGDNPPYSVAGPAGYSGIDVELARDLGRELGRPIELVRTRWTTLLADAAARRFDIAMSGISVTPERVTVVRFSRPYHRDRGVAVIRCRDASRFPSPDSVDRPGVEIFVNKGGASASYAVRRFPQATIRQWMGLEDAYALLDMGNGDLIVTSDLNAHHSIARSTDLCFAFDGAPLYETPIAILMPRNSELVRPVNAWLARRLRDQTVSRLLGR